MNSTLDLVARAKKGDSDAFQSLIHEEKEKLYKMAFVYMRNEEDSLEVFQETVYKAFVSISTLQENHYFSSWLVRILINTAIAHIKKKRKVVPMSHEILEGVGSTSHLKLEEQIDLLQAMEELEEKYKTVLLLRYYKDFTIKQISTFLNCPEGTVKTNLHRGLLLLKTKLKGAYDDERKSSFV
ncbi:sigma-70 family RNA polymerase sigma factor [Brevibacillus ginsengisoli]|uniref:sigma-70 family RNA polymerase sigma factor n=1 Tax=Brevibacillus ginsengisoli TaxID=363854 RepID=UPI003CED4DF9